MTFYCIVILFSIFNLVIFFFCVYIYLLFTNSSCLLNPQKISKRQIRLRYLTLHFGMNWIISCLWFFTFMHVLNFVSWICVIFLKIIRMIMWSGFIILRSPQKGVPWKSWLDPQFLRNPKLKQILKWLPLDRGWDRKSVV